MCTQFQKVSTRELYIRKVSENGYIGYTCAYFAFSFIANRYKNGPICSMPKHGG